MAHVQETAVVDEEREVLARDVDRRLGEVEQPAVAQPHLQEVPSLNGCGKPEDLREELRRRPHVPGRDDRVIEADVGHGLSLHVA